VRSRPGAAHAATGYESSCGAEEVTVDRAVLAEQRAGGEDDFAGGHRAQAEDRSVEARPVPDLGDLGVVGIEQREVDDLEADLAAARLVVQEPTFTTEKSAVQALS